MHTKQLQLQFDAQTKPNSAPGGLLHWLRSLFGLGNAILALRSSWLPAPGSQLLATGSWLRLLTPFCHSKTQPKLISVATIKMLIRRVQVASIMDKNMIMLIVSLCYPPEESETRIKVNVKRLLHLRWEWQLQDRFLWNYYWRCRFSFIL